MIKKLIRQAVARMGYTYSIVPLTSDEKSGAPAEHPVDKVCRIHGAPMLPALESPDQIPEAGPLFPAMTAAKLPPVPLTHYAGLDDALVDNISIKQYFSVEKRDGQIMLTDGLPGNPYVIRQKRILGGLRDTLGVQDLSGMSVLDIGCSCGYFTFAAARMGAREVLGVDARPEHADQFEILRASLSPLPMCRYQTVDMEHNLENLTSPFDIVFSMGVLYHTFDHVRFARNMYRLAGKAVYLVSMCSGHPELCEVILEDPANLRHSLHGPALYPSVGWMIDLMKWVGFKKVYYQRWPAFTPLRRGHNGLGSATLIAVK